MGGGLSRKQARSDRNPACRNLTCVVALLLHFLLAVTGLTILDGMYPPGPQGDAQGVGRLLHAIGPAAFASDHIAMKGKDEVMAIQYASHC
jgi:hypothetical protein